MGQERRDRGGAGEVLDAVDLPDDQQPQLQREQHGAQVDHRQQHQPDLLGVQPGRGDRLDAVECLQTGRDRDHHRMPGGLGAAVGQVAQPRPGTGLASSVGGASSLGARNRVGGASSIGTRTSTGGAGSVGARSRVGGARSVDALTGVVLAAGALGGDADPGHRPARLRCPAGTVAGRWVLGDRHGSTLGATTDNLRTQFRPCGPRRRPGAVHHNRPQPAPPGSAPRSEAQAQKSRLSTHSW